jgi:hypothetical protein
LIKGPIHVFGKRAFEDCPQGVTYLGTERSEALIKILDVDVNCIMNQVSDGERRRVQIFPLSLQ